MDYQSLIFNILLTLISTGLPILIGGATILIKQHFSAKQLNTAKIISMNSVEFVNQTTKDLKINNTEKLNSAILSARGLAEKAGIKLTSDQWTSLIESSVAQIKKGLITLTELPLTPSNIEPATIPTPIISDPIQPILNESAPIVESAVTPETIATPVVEVSPIIVPEIAPVSPVLNIIAIQEAVSTQMQELATKIATESVQKIMDDAVSLAVSNVTQVQ